MSQSRMCCVAGCRTVAQHPFDWNAEDDEQHYYAFMMSTSLKKNSLTNVTNHKNVRLLGSPLLHFWKVHSCSSLLCNIYLNVHATDDTNSVWWFTCILTPFKQPGAWLAWWSVPHLWQRHHPAVEIGSTWDLGIVKAVKHDTEHITWQVKENIGNFPQCFF